MANSIDDRGIITALRELRATVHAEIESEWEYGPRECYTADSWHCPIADAVGYLRLAIEKCDEQGVKDALNLIAALTVIARADFEVTRKV